MRPKKISLVEEEKIWTQHRMRTRWWECDGLKQGRKIGGTILEGNPEGHQSMNSRGLEVHR